MGTTAHRENNEMPYFRIKNGYSIEYISEGETGYEYYLTLLNSGSPEIKDYSEGQFDFDAFEELCAAGCPDNLGLNDADIKTWVSACTESWTEFVEAEASDIVIPAFWQYVRDQIDEDKERGWYAVSEL